jgi:anti-sigma B factor antagonist
MSELQLQRQGNVLIAQFSCQKLIDDVTITEIGLRLMRLADEPETKMVLDFQGVTFMTSAMMGKIVSLSKKCRAGNGELVVCNISPGTMGVFEKRLLNKVFKICDSTEEALNYFT